MGADIYLKSEVDARKDKGLPYDDVYKVGECYFRDSYNEGGFFRVMSESGTEWSWWRFADELPLDEDGRLTIDGAKELLRRLEATPVTDAMLRAWEAKRRADGWKFGENGERGSSVGEWFERHRQDHVNLCALLRKSIETGEPLVYSV